MDKSNTVLFMDSDEELWFTEAEKLKCEVISMPYVLDGKLYDYWLGKDFDGKGFFDKMRKGSVPTTCALNTEDYLTYFTPIFEKGKDIFYIHFSNKLSSTFKSLNMAIDELKEKFPERKIVLFDTLNISCGAGMLVWDMGNMFNEGKEVSEIIEYGQEHLKNYAEIFTVSDLKYLRRGGRLTSVQAFMGGVLNIKPLIKITNDGELKKFAQVSGRKKSLSYLVSYVKEKAIEVEKHEFIILHADCEDDAKYFLNQLKAIFPNINASIQIIGPTVGAHCGPDTLGISFYGKER